MRSTRIYKRNIVAGAIAPDHFKPFKKKPGGTVVGNLIRLAANKATGGILGTGANRLPVATVDTAKGPAPAWFGENVAPANQKSIQETVQSSTNAAVQQAVKNLPSVMREMLVNNQTEATNLPKTRSLRDAERTAENMTLQGSMSSGGQMIGGINPIYMLGILGAIIVLFMVFKKG